MGAGWSFSSLRGSPERAWNPEKAARPYRSTISTSAAGLTHCPQSGSDSKSALPQPDLIASVLGPFGASA